VLLERSMCSGVEEGDLAVIWRELIHGLRHEKNFHAEGVGRTVFRENLVSWRPGIKRVRYGDECWQISGRHVRPSSKVASDLGAEADMSTVCGVWCALCAYAV